MSDVREAIMARLEAIAATVDGIDHVERNVIRVDDTKNAAIYILEGDEEADPDDPVTRRPTGPRRINMAPQVVITRIKSADQVGPDLNQLRLATIIAIVSDTELQSLTLNKQGIRYEGMESDLAFGRQMVGQMALRFRLTCVLRIPEQAA